MLLLCGKDSNIPSESLVRISYAASTGGDDDDDESEDSRDM